MSEFGEQLRKFRHQCNDSKSPHGKLTQEKFGELVGSQLGISYSGAAISDWERGKSKIHVEDRLVLIALIQVLHKCEGLKTVEQANQLLEAGNYRALNAEEMQKIFREAKSDPDIERTKLRRQQLESVIPFLLKNLFVVTDEELQVLIAKTEQGPAPSWPRFIAVLLRKVAEHFSPSARTVLWVWVWLLAWWLVAPSLRWPYVNRNAAVQAIGMYVTGTLVIPLLIGLLIDTRHNEYWKQHGLANSTLLRLYTYQGAGIGFNLGYFFVFPLVLSRTYLKNGRLRSNHLLGADRWISKTNNGQ